jgi:Iap family predicted aminopeptidase
MSEYVRKLAVLFLIIINLNGFAQDKGAEEQIIGAAYKGNCSYNFLKRVCDEAGGRLMGTWQNAKAVSILREELAKQGIEAKSEKFTAAGWVRGADRIKMTSPAESEIKIAALGYTEKKPKFTADVFYAGYGFAEAYSGGAGTGRIALVTQEPPQGKEALLRYEAIDTAAKYGAKAILFINNKPGGMLLAGTSNFAGRPSAIPAFSISYEEGKRLQRLLENNVKVSLEITTDSYCRETESENVVVTFPGKASDKIIIGAHFDSWDAGQGAIDNGIGSAVLFDLARLFKTYSPENYYTVELVWFNGEELGLLGSTKYAEAHKNDKMKLMLNMDMIGSPTGYNVMGFQELIPVFEKMIEKLNGFDLSKGVVNYPYTNSDHIPFMFLGVPVFSMQAHLDEDQVKFYHDAGDTFDKVNIKYLSDAAAVAAVTIKEFANNEISLPPNKTEKEIIAILKKHGLDKRLKRQHEWIFNDEQP